jgi:hypothetical protein
MTKSGKPREVQPGTPPKAHRDVPDARTKNQKHGKTTADEWNQ